MSSQNITVDLEPIKALLKELKGWHTKGPWSANDSGTLILTETKIQEDGDEKRSYNYPTIVCGISIDKNWESNANLELIAKAPELLEVVEKLVNEVVWLRELFRVEDGDTDVSRSPI